MERNQDTGNGKADSMSPLVVFVVVTYNASRWIRKCLSSAQNQSGVTTAIIVIDNRSDDDTSDIVRTEFPEARLTINKENKGFGQANNQGISLAIQMGADYVFLLNQDAWIDQHCSRILAAAGRTAKSPGVLSPMHMEYEGSRPHSCMATYLQRNPSDIPAGEVINIPFVPAALWMIPAFVMRRAGGFDPVYFMYGEDDDLAKRIRGDGGEVLVVADARGYHAEKQGSPPLRRLAAKHYSESCALLRFSGHPVIRRYGGWFVQELRSLLNSLARLRFRQFVARVMALAWVIRNVSTIESSKRTLANSPGPFLSIRKNPSDYTNVTAAS